MADPAQEARAGVAEAEHLLDEGDYAASARRSADTWAALVRARPDLVVEPIAFDQPSVEGMVRLPVHAPWPSELGISMRDDGEGPTPVADKERFTMSEAAMMCEYTMEAVRRAEQEPPPAA
jgi:hypothetical protein